MSGHSVARRPAATRLASAALLGTAALAMPSCDPIEPRPLATAPMNRCPCESYEPGSSTPARCSSRDRCEILTAGGRPEFPFWILVHVPKTSIFAPGLTYVFVSDAQGNPAFTASPTPGVVTRCSPPLCLPLGAMVGASGAYKVTHEASKEVGYPLADGASLPVRVVYEPLGNGQQETFPSLPLDVLRASSLLDVNGAAEFRRPLPAGRYRRVFYPQPPFDAFFPPRVDEPPQIASDVFVDDTIIFGVDILLDDVVSRTATIARADGLDGWRAWLVDRPSQRRISVIRTLSGTDAEVPLFTSGAQPAFQRDDVDAIVAPPESFTAVPHYRTPIFGSGRVNITYPSIPPPARVSGVVVEPVAPNGGALFGYAARVTFESESLATNAEPTTLLRYSTTLNTDDRGRFATVLPPGAYSVTIEPAEGTGYATRKARVVVEGTHTALTFEPPPRTIVKGRAVLTDGRALSEAEVVAIPNTSPSARANPLVPRPRPGRTRTGDDGRFAFELDPGAYILSVIPKAGTGFPRVVIRPDVPGSLTAQETELPEIRVPAPIRLAFTLRDPGSTGNPIAEAVVRVFARPASPSGATGTTPLPDPVEIGSAMTGPDGSVEILLAQEPR